MRFRLIDAAKKEFPVQRLCKVLGVSQSGYFAWKDRPACRRQNEDMVLLTHIRSAFALSNATYGSPRMTRELRDDGITIGRHRVARLMRENALKARQRRRFKRPTDSLHAFPVAPNLLNQDFNATGPNQKWGADISYVWTREGWLYLAVVIDLFARRVVGWAAGDRLHKELALLALRRAVAVRCPSASFVFELIIRAEPCSVYVAADIRDGAAAGAAGDTPALHPALQNSARCAIPLELRRTRSARLLGVFDPTGSLSRVSRVSGHVRQCGVIFECS